MIFAFLGKTIQLSYMMPMACMTYDEIETLIWMLAIDRPVTKAVIASELADRPLIGEAEYEFGRRRLKPLIDAGAVVKVKPTQRYVQNYVVTERGRIAAALLMAKSPYLRAAFFE